MARIAGVDLPVNKRLWVGLTAIYGIGQVRAKKLAEKSRRGFHEKNPRPHQSRRSQQSFARPLSRKAASKAISARRFR